LRNQLQSLISQVKKKDNLLATKNKEFHDFKEGIRTILSENQLALQKKKKIKWTVDEISKAFTIRYLSKRCYFYLRNTLNYKLPGISSLQRWASRIDMRQGVLQDILRVMQAIGLTMTDIERTTVLAFDEIKVFSLDEYDKQHDEILGPHKHMQVVMARGLFTNWKQPIFVNFDTKMTKSILMDIIDKLHTASYSVVACVSDCGGGNIGLWKELGITIEQTNFLHPITNEAVYVFTDAPHLLKLIRNWFIDTGFILENGSLITKQPLEALMQQTTESEVSSCYKLTSAHLKCQKAERQNVALAAQLMSHTTATALIHYKPGLDKSLAQSTGEFIELISNWFDIMNSYSPEANVPSKKPFGSDFQFQINVLDSVYDKISTMRCIKKNTLQIFQKGMLISIQSLKQLFNTLKAKYDFKYILTHCLNQDALENFFSQIRTRGGLYDHPTPIHALHRIRMIILGKNPGIVQKNLNTVEATHDEYMFVKAMEEAHISIQTENIELPVQENSDTESFSSTSTSPAGNQRTIILTCVLEKDGLKYLAGWIAKKFKHKYPHLG
ncbi:Transposable element P transposase, partial [Camponotus floridanus]